MSLCDSFLFVLPICCNVSKTIHVSRKATPGNDIRLQQYMEGIPPIVKHIRDVFGAKSKIWLVDNSVSELPKELADLCASLDICHSSFVKNEWGAKNKGLGIVEAMDVFMRNEVLDGIKQVVFYEPRQILRPNSPFLEICKSSKEQILFKQTGTSKSPDVYTGFYSISLSSLREFISEVSSSYSSNVNVSIELLLYRFIQKKKIPHQIVSDLGISWRNHLQSKQVSF